MVIKCKRCRQPIVITGHYTRCTCGAVIKYFKVERGIQENMKNGT